jgi:hypothetical protein
MFLNTTFACTRALLSIVIRGPLAWVWSPASVVVATTWQPPAVGRRLPANPELEVSVRGLMRLASSFRYASLLTVTVTVRPVMVPSGGSCFVTVSPCRLQPTRFYAKHGHEFPIATAVYKRFMSTQVTTVRLEVSGGVCFFTICSAES